MNWTDRMKNQRSNTDRSTEDPLQPDGSAVQQAMTPIPEKYPEVFPYRGMETHGVEPTGYPHLDVPALVGDERGDPEWTEPSEDVRPIPVRLVNESSDEFRSFRTGQLAVNPNVTLLFGRDRSRRKLIMQHRGPANEPMVIGHSPNLTLTSGWVLDTMGQSYSVESSEPVYLCAPNGNQLFVMFSQEYITNPDDQTIR